jgi:ankyrin repeat protein
VRALLAAGAHPVDGAQDASRRTPLHAAAAGGHLRCMELLVDAVAAAAAGVRLGAGGEECAGAAAGAVEAAVAGGRGEGSAAVCTQAASGYAAAAVKAAAGAAGAGANTGGDGGNSRGESVRGAGDSSGGGFSDTGKGNPTAAAAAAAAHWPAGASSARPNHLAAAAAACHWPAGARSASHSQSAAVAAASGVYAAVSAVDTRGRTPLHHAARGGHAGQALKKPPLPTSSVLNSKPSDPLSLKYKPEPYTLNPKP